VAKRHLISSRVVSHLGFVLVFLAGCSKTQFDGYPEIPSKQKMTATLLQVCFRCVLDQYRDPMAWYHAGDTLNVWNIVLESQSKGYNVLIMKEVQTVPDTYWRIEGLTPESTQTPIDEFTQSVAEKAARAKKQKVTVRILEKGNKSINGIAYSYAIANSADDMKFEGLARAFKAPSGKLIRVDIVFSGHHDAYQDEDIQDFMRCLIIEDQTPTNLEHSAQK
jgi:hypothetical protein